MTIERFTDTATKTIAASSTTSDKVECAAYSSGSFKIRDAVTGSSVTFEQYDEATESWEPIYDSEGSAFTISVAADQWYCLPTEMVMCVDNFRFVGSSQAAARTISLRLKK